MFEAAPRRGAAWRASSVFVSVMKVRVVRVRVAHGRVAVRVRVRLARWVVRPVRVLVVFVVDVRVFVDHLLVLVFVVVSLGQMKPHA